MAYENKWVADITNLNDTWSPKTWNGLSSFSGKYVWTDGVNTYYSNDGDNYILDKATDTWIQKTWNGISSFSGEYIWTDGTDTYCSYDSKNYILDKATDTWIEKTNWSSVHARDIWTDGEDMYYTVYYGGQINIFIQRVLDRTTDKWVNKTTGGSLARYNGRSVWNYEGKTYFSGGFQYEFDTETDSWIQKTWNGFSSISGEYIWTDGNYAYCSYEGKNYILDKRTDTWILEKTWNDIDGQNIWSDGENTYYSDGQVNFKFENGSNSIVTPYRQAYPELIETDLVPDKWVGDRVRVTKKWQDKTWSGGIGNIWGYNVWTDGTDIYYSNNTYQWVLNRATSTWSQKTWNGLTSFDGCDVWTDGTDIYYSFDGNQYVLDKATSTWTAKTWRGLTSYKGQHIWYDSGNVYYSYNSNNYILNKTTSTWIAMPWNGTNALNGLNVWKDGDTVYFSSGNNGQYVLNKKTKTWEEKTWNGITIGNLVGQRIWTDGIDIYLSDSSGAGQYTLNRDTDTWEYNYMTNNIVSGLYVWHDGDNIYYSYGRTNFKFNRNTVITTPYRLKFTPLQTSIPARWFIDDDIPYHRRFPALNTSRNFGDEWLIDNDIPYRHEYLSLKESFNIGGEWLSKNEPDTSSTKKYLKFTHTITATFTAGNRTPTVTYTLPDSVYYTTPRYYDQGVSSWSSIYCRIYVPGDIKVLRETWEFSNTDIYGIMNPASNATSYFLKRNGYTTTMDLVNKPLFYDSGEYPWAYPAQDYGNNKYYVEGYFTMLRQLTPSESGSTTITFSHIFEFDSENDDYSAFLAAYPNNVEPWYPMRKSIPYRLDFPSFNSSLPGSDIWLIDDDIPFRIDFPDLLESVGAPESWLQDNGWEPRRPWPRHKNIILEVQTIEDIPPVDWTKSMKQDFEFYTVDPHTWFDDKKLDNIISCNLTHDATTDKRGNASITLTEAIPECYIRTYLVVTQNGRLYKFCLGTFLYMTSSDSFDGMKHNITMTGYTPLVELEEQYPKLGYHVVGYTNRKYGAEAPMVTDEIRDIILENTRCEVESRVMINKPLLNDFVPGQNDNWLTVVNNILNASSLQSYILTVDEWGTIIIKDAPSIDDVATSFTYNDDNSSILLPTLDTFDDIYGIPNVMEVLYVGDKNLPAIRVVVKNEDEQSIVSIPRRGREIVKRYTINNIAAPLNDQTYASVYAQVEAQAYKLLEAASTIQKTISYSHGYCDVKVGDMVLINYERAGMNNVRAKVVSQRISCKPGCQVDEQAVYTKKLWNRGV